MCKSKGCNLVISATVVGKRRASLAPRDKRRQLLSESRTEPRRTWVPINPEHLRRRAPLSFRPLPPSPSRLMLLYLQPSPRIREVETTSRHFVCADRPSETGGDNPEKERLRRPKSAAPGTAGGGRERTNLPVLSKRAKASTKR